MGWSEDRVSKSSSVGGLVNQLNGLCLIRQLGHVLSHPKLKEQILFKEDQALKMLEATIAK